MSAVAELRHAAVPLRRRWKALARRRLRRTGGNLARLLLALPLVGFSLLPLAWGISTALKRNEDVYVFPPVWIPPVVTFQNFASAVANPALLSSFVNSLIIATATTMIALLVGVLGGYGFSRYRFPGRDTLLWSLLFTKLFPRVVVIVPFFVTLQNLDLMNTYTGLVMVYLMAVFPVAIWLLKGFFDHIPIEIEEAAIIDGCSVPQLLWHVVIPLSRPALGAVAMYAFIIAWNEFLFALVFTTGLSRRPLSVALAFFIDDNGIRWGELMAASVIMSLPAVVVFSLAQRMLVRGLSEGAVTAHDLNGALRFYRDDLGMKVLKQMEVPARSLTMVYLHWDYDVLELLHRPEPNMTDSMYGHVAMRVDDVDAAQRWFTELGVPAEPGMPKPAGTGIGRIGMVRDPDGVKIELVDRADLRAL